MKKIAIVQSNYLPWRGYFDLIKSVDEFILLDDVQYTKRDWRNRNKIKTSRGEHWLTIPIQVKGNFLQSIKEAKIADPQWGKNHWAAIKTNYSRAPFFKTYKDFFENLYLNQSEPFLTDINFIFLKQLLDLLDIKTPLRKSGDYGFEKGEKSKQLISLCKKSGADGYVSGPAALSYLDQESFKQEGITVEIFSYGPYSPYKQLYSDFIEKLSIIDLILNTGPEAPKLIKGLN